MDLALFVMGSLHFSLEVLHFGKVTKSSDFMKPGKT